jgi:hypothetical protein
MRDTGVALETVPRELHGFTKTGALRRRCSRTFGARRAAFDDAEQDGAAVRARGLNAQPGVTRIVATKAGRTFLDTEVTVLADRNNTLAIVRAVD